VLAIPAETQRQLDRLTFVSRRPARAGAGGEHASRRPAASTDFVDYRPYHPGDDFRRVDWNVYGRLGSLQVKLTEGRERLDVLLTLDCSSAMACGTPDKLTFASQLVAALAYVGAARADSVRVVCLGQAFPGRWPLRRRSRLPDVMRELGRIVPTAIVDLNASFVNCVPRETPANSLCVIVSDLMTPDGVANGIDALRGRVADVAVLHVVAPDELEPKLTGEVELIDAESDATSELGVSLATLSAYRARFQAWLDAREAECRARGLRYARLTTDTPLSTAVLRDLRQIGLLK
jgi:uncharacterized protein (DUF58 family)